MLAETLNQPWGYVELASRYNSPSETVSNNATAASSGASAPPARAVTRLRRPRMRNSLRSLVKWFDRRG